MAAGLSLNIADIDTLRNMLNENATLTDSDLIPKTWIDVPMPVSYISMGLVEQLKLLEPFGKGNEKPVFADRNLYVKKADIIGANTKDGCLMNAVQFNVNEGDKIPEAGSSILVVYYPDINVYRGIASLQIIVKEWKE